MTICAPGMSMRDFATAKTRELLDITVEALMVATHSAGVEAVHKMRVSIRRLQQALRLFKQYFRKRGIQRVKKDLKEIMTAAGELRNHDIAIALVRRVGTPVPVLVELRMAAKQQLSDVLRRIVQPDLRERWVRRLGIGAHEEESVEA